MFFREWFVVFCAICFIVAISLMEVFAPAPVMETFAPAAIQKIYVTMTGAVERPGTYEVDVGSSVHEVAVLAGLKQMANRKALYLKKKLLYSCSLNVPEKNVKKNKKKKKSSSSMPLTSCAG